MQANPLIFLSAGEASGDQYGAELIASLKSILPLARFTGLGGLHMEAAGQHRVIRAEDIAVMGITEILKHVPRILASYRKLVHTIYAERPQVAVLIDFPDVNFRLAKHLKRMGVPVIWFVSPQLWAWKRRRLRWVQSRVATMLTIFPFETEFYRARGVDAQFVGHPLAEAPIPAITREEYAAAHLFTPREQSEQSSHFAKPWIALLPGSRWKELSANLPTMLDAAALLGSGYHFLIPVASTLNQQRVSEYVFTLLRSIAAWPPESSLTLVPDARAALLHSRAAVVASGTATVQAAVLGTPFVAVCRVSNITFRLAKRLVRYPADIPAELDPYGNLPIAMPNLIAGHRIVPELLQQNFTADRVVRELKPLIADGPARETQLAALRKVREKLLHPSGAKSIDLLRNAVLAALGLAFDDAASQVASSSGERPAASNL